MQQYYQCPTCGSSVSYGTQFCGNCGAPFAWEQQAAPPPPQQQSGGWGQPPPQQAGWQQQPPHYQQQAPPQAQQQSYYGRQSASGQPPAFNPTRSPGQPGYYGYGTEAPRRQGKSPVVTILVILLVIAVAVGAVWAITGGKFNIIPSGSPTPATTAAPKTPPPPTQHYPSSHHHSTASRNSSFDFWTVRRAGQNSDCHQRHLASGISGSQCSTGKI